MMLRYLYSALLYLACPFFLIKLYRAHPDKPAVGRRWREHFGFCPPLTGQRPVWIHAVSVGEVIAASELIRALHRQHPNQALLLTTTTSTGAAQAAKLADIAEHRYMPLDFGWAVRRFLNITRPRALLIMETELWPNTLHQAKRTGIPVTVLNARLSERSCQRYRKVQPLFDLARTNIDLLLCQHPDDAERFQQLGISPSQVQVTGSLKFDLTISDTIRSQGAALRRQLGSRPVWIAASTHQGEDEQILAAFRQIKTQCPDALLMLVPRHPERFAAVAQLCRQDGFQLMRRTDAGDQPIPASCEIYLGDTMGEMLMMFAAADIAFVGGSLIGDKVGGHNMLEPAALAKPVLTGPSYYNFTDIAQQLIHRGGCWVCEDAAQLAQQVTTLLRDTQQCEAMGANARAVLEENQGAIAKTLAAISQTLTAQ
ncbi:lipid IV(A) 3-deoxy-D-manno-octulosonic acid transferase [Photobacterium sp. MCCC 1A19761]|uniref:lipid IV(A) 3-deoxy-D-manno-octulosonic acid transferase n=1 Tax=Photobacterium sp. MCCC 1A19761 TaxID=3115000 RepID=UPI00307ECB32